MAIFESIGKGFKKIFSFASLDKLGEDELDEIEAILIQSDIGQESVETIIESFKKSYKKGSSANGDTINSILSQELTKLLATNKFAVDLSKKPYTIMVIGVNGTGKTSTIAKLAYHFKKQGLSVALAAGDTFRAGAIEQLTIWADRVGCKIIKGNAGADPAAIIYDAYESAKCKDTDILLIDTAGRLHNKKHLMEELDKIYRVFKKHGADLPHETFLILDSTTGKNGVEQAKVFNEISPITGIVLTKLDGTAKGGTIFPIKKILNAPVRFITYGEKFSDIEEFHAETFVKRLLEP